ncbi:phosphotransferase [Actinoplanes sp. TRM 88003]|uniref:Phosphotransferase n=1 Tax=Paractinoplanes aksuensis TaxID=2939490 RepID=A0ABT1DZA9_9ACTN|nr:phosphotransferase [Actinoplanes aksuensis]MCO8275908.1 phosphotransferase [Actinoplanes aksuensis]
MESKIKAWVEEVALPGQRITGTRALTGGYSNDNTVLTTTGGGEYVLRRYLRSNKCALEAALAHRLTGVVPVAEVVAADPSGEKAGEPVLLSVFVPGTPVNELDEDAFLAVAHDVGATLARIGAVEFAAPGFFSGGRLEPDGAEPAEGLDLWVDRCLKEGNAAGHLTPAEQDSLRRWARDAAPELASLKGSRRLVHSDYNPKNLLAAQSPDGSWRVAAVLDWEFAFSSTPLVDIGNMLRFPRPEAFTNGFLAGFRDGGGALPPNWRRLSQALDLFALADFLTRPVDHRYFTKAINRIRVMLAG